MSDWFSDFFIQILVTLATPRYPAEFKTYHGCGTSATTKKALNAEGILYFSCNVVCIQEC